MIDIAKYIKKAKAKYDSYDCNVWIKAGFDENSGGFNVYHIEHDFSETGRGGDAEETTGKMLAKLGKQVEFLPEGKRMTPDLYFDGQTWEIKYINSKLSEIKEALERETGKLQKLGRISEMPDIFYIDKSGMLKAFWEKQKGLNK